MMPRWFEAERAFIEACRSGAAVVDLGPPDTKQCSWCKETYLLEFFNLRRDSKDGYTSHCKECSRAKYAETQAKKKKKETPPVAASGVS